MIGSSGSDLFGSGTVAACLFATALVLVLPGRGRGWHRRVRRITRIGDWIGDLAAAGTPRFGDHRGNSLAGPTAPVDRNAEKAAASNVREPSRADRLLATRSGRHAVTAIAAGAGWLGVGGVPGVIVAGLVAVAVEVGIQRLRGRSDQDLTAQALAELPLAVDLFAACLRAGSPPELAAGAVGRALGGAIGQRLAAVARSLELGTPPAEAWSALEEISVAAPATRALARCADSGAALAAALTRLASELRAARAARARAAAHRVGVLVVLPLGLCFLPAFVCVGVVPLVVGVLAQVLP